MLIAVLNQSTLVDNDQAAAMTQAVASQIRYDTAPAWDRNPAAVVFYTDPVAVPPNAHGVAIVDTIQNEPQGVLGYHTEDPGGNYWGIVAAKPSLDNGGSVLTGDWSVSSILSHEVQEMFGDPNVNLWGASGRYMYSLELCDPVEAPTYPITGVSVSNFITPAWFDPLAVKTAKFDHLGLLRAPFSLLHGGYMVYSSEGRERQKFGDRYPDWRINMKQGALARTQRRRAQVSALDNSGQ